MSNEIAPELRKEDSDEVTPDSIRGNVSPAIQAQDFELSHVSYNDLYRALCTCV